MRSLLALVLVGLASGVLPASAQTTLGTIRGTVYDPQQGVVPGRHRRRRPTKTPASTREVTTDAQGLFEMPNLRPGTYTVDVSLSGFKKTQRTGVVLRPRVGGARRYPARGRRPRGRRHRDRRGPEQHHRREPVDRARPGRAAVARPAAQQPRHPGLPRRSTRTSSAASTRSSSWAAAPTAPRTSRTASRRRPGSSASCPTPRLAWTPIAEVQVLSNSYSAEFGGLAGVVVSTKRGTNQFHGTSFYDFNCNELNARTYAQTLNGVVARRPERRHARPSLRLQHRRADHHATGRSSSATTTAAG